ncbi:hypothetical protein NQP46_26070 [Streptomyces albus]|nr:hypothetical protein NQP46_26070 [Streptomyces albus]
MPQDFGPWFWTALALPAEDRADLLRRLLVADGTGGDDRFLAAAGEFLVADARTAQPLLCAWFGDARRLPALPAATVATAAQALLYTHREGHVDTLVDALVADGHERADELLSTLAEEDPGAVCRGVARWAVDPRPARRVAAVAYGLRAAPYAASEADRELLRVAAATLLSRTADAALHGGALALLVRDPVSRGRYVEQAAARFAAVQDPQLTAAALGVALATHRGPVLDAYRRRLAAPGSQVGDVLRVLAEETAPAVAAPATAFAGNCSGRAPARRATSRRTPNAAWRGAGPTRRSARWSAPRSVRGRPPSVPRWRPSWRRRRRPPAPRSVANCWRNCSGTRPIPTSSRRSSSHWSSATTRAPVRRRGSGTDTPRGCGARSCAWGRCWPGARRGRRARPAPGGAGQVGAGIRRVCPGLVRRGSGVWRALVGSGGLRTIEDVAAAGSRTASAGTPDAERVPSAWHS